jgi:Acetyltransferases
MSTICIKSASVKDIAALQQISRQTFYETFSAYNTKEDMQKYLDENLSAEQLSVELNQKESEFYFALVKEQVIGYLKLNFGQSQTEIREGNGLEIERIYVLREFHGKNIGQKLYEKAIEVATEKRVDYVWLGVWEENRRALRFYRKNGFVAFDKHIFKLGNDVQTDIMMKRRINRA